MPTSGRIAGGAIVEREIDFKLNDLVEVRLALRNPDFTTAERMSTAINGFPGGGSAHILDPATVMLAVPPSYHGRTAELLTAIEQPIGRAGQFRPDRHRREQRHDRHG